MISLETIEREINELENHRDTTYAVCQRLAWLYTVRDHMLPSESSPEVARLSGSEFLETCSGVSFPALMRILDEHMETIRLLYPTTYENLLQKIRALK